MNSPFKVAQPPNRPLMIYDGACDFCARGIERWRRVVGETIEYIPSVEVVGRFPEISQEQYDEAVHFVETDGRVSRGAEAAFRSLASGRGVRWPLWIYDHVPGFAGFSEAFYRIIARRRHCRVGAMSNIERSA